MDIGFAATYVGLNDAQDMFHWRVKLTFESRSYALDYHCGFGHASRTQPRIKPGAPLHALPRFVIGRLESYPQKVARALKPHGKLAVDDCEGDFYILPPTCNDVLASLRSDASVPEFFEDFCSEFGYDPDSRKAEATHRACRKARHEMYKLLGAANFETFMATDWERAE